MEYVLLAVVLAVGVFLGLRIGNGGGLGQRLVYDYEHGLLYRNGKFQKVLDAGRYGTWGLFERRDVFTLPKAPQTLATPGAVDVVSVDGFVYRITARVDYVIADPRKAYETLYADRLQDALGDALVQLCAERSLDAFMESRAALGAEIVERMPVPDVGCAVTGAAVTGVTLPPETRRLFVEVERAKREGLAALERARGEQAALRSLANAARMLKGNPELVNLRLLHALAGQGGRSQPTLVLGDGALQPLRRDGSGDPDEA